MEGEKKRKRGANGERNGGDRRKKEVEETVLPDVDLEDEAVATTTQPSEEEVEEFFTILRRMHVAVKYFEKTGTNISDVNGGGLKLMASEKSAVDDGVKIDKKKSVGVETGGLDLNVIPEADS